MFFLPVLSKTYSTILDSSLLKMEGEFLNKKKKEIEVSRHVLLMNYLLLTYNIPILIDKLSNQLVWLLTSRRCSVLKFPGRVKILLVTSCHRNWDTFQSNGLLGWNADLHVTFTSYMYPPQKQVCQINHVRYSAVSNWSHGNYLIHLIPNTK